MRPTPRDLARRASSPQFVAPVSAPAPAAPPAAAPAPPAPFRLRWERAVRRSSLPANARLVALVLATYGDFTTGSIPPACHPSSEGLARAAGIPASLVRQCLRTLSAGGWINQEPPPPIAHAAALTTLLLPARASTPPNSTIH